MLYPLLVVTFNFTSLQASFCLIDLDHRSRLSSMQVDRVSGTFEVCVHHSGTLTPTSAVVHASGTAAPDPLLAATGLATESL